MVSTKPYLIRAIYEWCVDQGFVPYMTVVADERTRVPREHVKDGQITLNIGPEAAHQLNCGNEDITFQARFNGVAFPVAVPVDAVAAIFARENGQGMAFDVTPTTAPQDPPPAEESGGGVAAGTPEKPRSHLTRVK